MRRTLKICLKNTVVSEITTRVEIWKEKCLRGVQKLKTQIGHQQNGVRTEEETKNFAMVSRHQRPGMKQRLLARQTNGHALQEVPVGAISCLNRWTSVLSEAPT